MQLCDSALPVGGFSFSCALESAVAQGVVRDEATLEEFVQTVVRQTLFQDGVAALYAFRNSSRYDEVLRADRELYVRKIPREWRTMSTRMGRKLAELGAEMLPCPELERWQKDIADGVAWGNYAVSQGLLFSLCGATEEELFSAVGYGAAAMVAGAALRLMRITHHHTQRILFATAFQVEELYPVVAGLTLEQMQGFAPQLEVLSSLHERGTQRMFMS